MRHRVPLFCYLAPTLLRFVAILRELTTFYQNMPKHVAAKKRKEYTDCRTVHLLALPKSEYSKQ